MVLRMCIPPLSGSPEIGQHVGGPFYQIRRDPPVPSMASGLGPPVLRKVI